MIILFLYIYFFSMRLRVLFVRIGWSDGFIHKEDMFS